MQASNRARPRSLCSRLAQRGWTIRELKRGQRLGCEEGWWVLMSNKSFRPGNWWLVVVALFALGQCAPAGNAPQVSGSYEVVQNTNHGSQAQIRMRIHLVNHGPQELSIQKMILWDFSHPDRGGAQAAAVTLHAHASADTTQEFTIRRPEFESWRRGMRPRLVLELAAPGHSKSTAVVRLDRISGQEVK